MTHFFRKITVVAFVFAFAKPAQAQTLTPSADDTVANLNTTLHRYPTLEFVDSGCPGYEQVVAISADRRSLIIKQNFGRAAIGTCEDVQTLTVPVFSLHREGIGKWSKQGQHSSFFLDCTNRVSCFSRRSDARPLPYAENQWLLQMTAPDQVSIQFRKTIQDLMDSLLTEANARLDGRNSLPAHGH